MKRRTLLLGFGILGATVLSGGGTVYGLNTLGLAPKVPVSAAASDSVAGAQATPEKPSEARKVVEVTPEPANGPRWSYEGATGPDHWGDVDPANAVCKVGGS